MVRIRLRRMGLRNRPTYRVVAIDSRLARDGRYLEMLGHYDPRKKITELNHERIQYWLSKGAQPSATVDKLIRRQLRAVPAPEAPADAATAPACTAPADQGA